MKSRVEIYESWCKKCGICVAFYTLGVPEIGKDGYCFVKAPGSWFDRVVDSMISCLGLWSRKGGENLTRRPRDIVK